MRTSWLLEGLPTSHLFLGVPKQMVNYLDSPLLISSIEAICQEIVMGLRADRPEFKPYFCLLCMILGKQLKTSDFPSVKRT